jgi:ribosome biogenesis GTPase
MERETGALDALGWDAWFEAAYVPLAADGWSPARVVAEHRNAYVVAGVGGDRPATVAGRLRHQARMRDELPAVGDWVAVAGGADGGASIRAVLPRRSAFRRKVAGESTVAQVVAANVDVVLIATALPGDANVRRLERYLALAWESGATPVVVLTKADLSDDHQRALAAMRAAAPGVDVVAISSLTGEGVPALDRYLRPGRTAALLGSSGVGKSTLINRLLGHERLRTSAVREDGKGRHTTTHRELVRLAAGALLIDTPGMRELQLWDADAGLDAAFLDVEAIATRCRFRDCRHDAEPGCAVRAAVAAGTLDGERVAHWHKLQRELAHLAARQDEVAAAVERSRSKASQRALRAHLRRKYRA